MYKVRQDLLDGANILLHAAGVVVCGLGDVLEGLHVFAYGYVSRKRLVVMLEKKLTHS